MFLGNNLKNQKLSDVVKNFAKITEKHMYWGLFFNKDSFWGLQLYYKETPVLVFFVNYAKFLKTLILETSMNDCF